MIFTFILHRITTILQRKKLIKLNIDVDNYKLTCGTVAHNDIELEFGLEKYGYYENVYEIYDDINPIPNYFALMDKDNHRPYIFIAEDMDQKETICRHIRAAREKVPFMCAEPSDEEHLLIN